MRWGIRRLLRRRLLEQDRASSADPDAGLRDWIRTMRDSPLAVEVDRANEQHYEVPAAFFQQVLGRHLKYSSGYWPKGVRDLDEAEASMLALTCQRAALEDGMDILELGCGWGSLTLWMAEQYPSSRIVAVSNSRSQRMFIEERARLRGLDNIEVRTADMNVFEPDRLFDRVVSVEMFEHMRNWEKLLRRVRAWMNPAGRAFIHVFAHRRFAYPFETEGSANWMGRYFFTGGMMPADDLLPRLDCGLDVEEHWVVNGRHYARTADAWLANLEARRAELLPVLRRTYGEGREGPWFERWRLFFLACSELFGFSDGEEWWVSHYRLKPAEARTA